MDAKTPCAYLYNRLRTDPSVYRVSLSADDATTESIFCHLYSLHLEAITEKQVILKYRTLTTMKVF